MDAADLQSAILSLPSRKGSGFRRWCGGAVKIEDGLHEITEQIVVPNDIGVQVYCESRTSAALVNKSGKSSIFRLEGDSGVGHEFRLKNIALFQGGVSAAGKRRGYTCLDNCKVIQAPVGLSLTGGTDRNLGPANWESINTDFIECGKSFFVQAKSHTLGVIRGGRSLACHETSMFFDCIGVHVYSHDFAGSGGRAFIQYGGDAESSSHHIVSGCRFSSEDVNSEDGVVPTPFCDVLIGNEDGPSERNASVLRFRDNLHAGARPGDSGAEHAFVFNNRAMSTLITGSRFTKNYKQNVIQQNHDMDPLDCHFFSNFVQDKSVPVFNKSPW